MKKVCVTGALGFAGFHLCNKLLEEGVEVIGIDSHDDKRALEQEEMELRIGRNALFQLFKAPIEELEKKILWKEIDVCFHMASLQDKKAKPKDEKRILTFLTNNLTSESTFIYPVYTVNSNHSGLLDEAREIKSYLEKNTEQISYQIVQLPNLYGPWQGEGMEGESERSLYISDAVKGILLAARCNSKNQIIYLPTFYEMNKIDRETTSKLDDHTHVQFQAAEKIGYRPEVEFKVGVAKCIEHMKQWQKQLELFKGSD